MVVLLYEGITEPVRHLHRLIDEGHERWVLAKDYLDLLKVRPALSRGEGGSRTGKADVFFAKVNFRYPGSAENALTDVTLNISAGTRVAVVGPSGGGKSTLELRVDQSGMRRLARHEHISWLWAGKDPLPIYLPRVGMLSQDVYIFAGTVAENIRYGQPEATAEQVELVASIAGLADFIDSHPLRYEAPLGHHGVGLSGGQKQRLGLARVLLQDPDVLVLDEPSSNLDPQSSRRFFQQVLQSFPRKTIVVITHDLDNLDWADQLVMIENGTLRETGTPHELLRNDSAVRALRDDPGKLTRGAFLRAQVRPEGAAAQTLR